MSGGTKNFGTIRIPALAWLLPMAYGALKNALVLMPNSTIRKLKFEIVLKTIENMEIQNLKNDPKREKKTKTKDDSIH